MAPVTSDPRPPDPLVLKPAFQRLAHLREVAPLSWRDGTMIVTTAELAELEAANADLVAQRDKAELQRSEALTQQETRLEFCRKERDEEAANAETIAALLDESKAREAALRAKVAECEAEHPPEKPYLEWCAAGKPDVSKLREALLKRTQNGQWRCDHGNTMLEPCVRYPDACEHNYVRAALEQKA